MIVGTDISHSGFEVVGTLIYNGLVVCFEEALKLAFIDLFLFYFLVFNKKVSFDAWCVVVGW